MLVDEADHLSRIHEHVGWIQKELQAMVAFLKDADRRQQRDERVAAWVREVRDLVYEAEDVIDEYVTKMAALRWNSLSFFKYFYVRYHVGNQIIRIKKEVIEVNARKDRYGFRGVQEDAPPSTHGYRGPGAASPFIQEEDIVGIEDDVEQLSKILLEGNQRSRLVLSVFGMGGLGKTTLVKEVFKKSKRKFDCYSWVFVSQSCSLRDVLKNILFGFKESRGEPAMDVMDTMDEGRLQERTYHYLLDKKYLLVLDDIWDNKLWEEVKLSLPGKRGRVMFTTRIRDIAAPDEENYHIYDLQPLPYELAWSIFCKKAFRSDKTCPEDLREFAEDILRRCGGLPLAIVAIGGLLSTKGTNLPAWQSVLHAFDWELNHHRDIERLDNALLFSYNYLPYYLKHCFLHIGLFPEDYEIGRKMLIRMWVAEGFIKEVPGMTLEEVANHYFMQLIDRSMIQAVRVHARDVVKACKIHDLMRDIANRMLKEEKFGSILEEGMEIVAERHRRLSIYDTADNIPSNTSKLNLRSLLMFRISEISSSVLQKIMGQLKLVRVLDFQGAPLEKLPNEIGESIHLRYLGLRGTLIENLPKSLINLRNLQTLDVRRTNVRQLPAGINKLPHLRHLLLSSFRDRGKGFLKMSEGRKSFLNLQTLSGVEADEYVVKEIRCLTRIRKLYIGGMTGANSKEFCQSLEGMSNLRSLTIVSDSPQEQEVGLDSLSQSPCYLEKLKLQVYMKKLPKWFSSLDCLHTLSLFKNFLGEDPVPVLEKLPNLTILTLASSAFTSKDIKCTPRGFPKLKLLRILDIENWIRWMPIEEGTMPGLQYLLIADCPKLVRLPDGFHHLTALQDLTLAGTSAYFSHRLHGDDRWKVSHIREVSIISQVNGKFIKKRFH